MLNINWKTIRFIIVGAAGALIYLLCSYALIAFFHLEAYVASLIAYATSFSFAYLGQKIWAFRSIAPHSVTFTRYALLQLFCASFAATFSQLAANQGSLSALQLSTAASFLTALISYWASSYWVFADNTDQHPYPFSPIKKTWSLKLYRFIQTYQNQIIILIYLALCIFLYKTLLLYAFFIELEDSMMINCT